MTCQLSSASYFLKIVLDLKKGLEEVLNKLRWTGNLRQELVFALIHFTRVKVFDLYEPSVFKRIHHFPLIFQRHFLFPFQRIQSFGHRQDLVEIRFPAKLISLGQICRQIQFARSQKVEHQTEQLAISEISDWGLLPLLFEYSHLSIHTHSVPLGVLTRTKSSEAETAFF